MVLGSEEEVGEVEEVGEGIGARVDGPAAEVAYPKAAAVDSAMAPGTSGVVEVMELSEVMPTSSSPSEMGSSLTAVSDSNFGAEPDGVDVDDDVEAEEEAAAGWVYRATRAARSARIAGHAAHWGPYTADLYVSACRFQFSSFRSRVRVISPE